MTPNRGLKKLVKAGALAPGRTLAVFGVGGLGAFAVQYAKLLAAGASVVAFARTDDKLELARATVPTTPSTRATNPSTTCASSSRDSRAGAKSTA